MESERSGKEIAAGLQAVKLALAVLGGCVIVLSTAYNIYVLRQNSELSRMLAKAVFELEQMRYERDLMNSFVRDIESYSRDHPEAEEIMARYRIRQGRAAPDDRAEKPLPR